MKFNVKNSGSSLIIFLILVLVFNFIYPVRAAGVINFSDTLSAHDTNTVSNHTIVFTTPSGVGAGQTMTLTFAAGFNIGSVDFTDIDLEDDGAELSLAALAAGATWGASFSGQVLTITSGTGTIAGSSVVTIEIGTHATSQVNGDQQITNPVASGSYIIDLDGTFGDTGHLAVASTGDSSVTVAAATAGTSGGGPGPGGPGDTSPIISNVEVINITADSATVIWQTNETATSFVDYGLTTSYELGTESVDQFVTSHSVDLAGLDPETVYYFQVRSFDNNGNEGTSSGYSFTTLSMEVEEGYLYLRAVPEKRLPAEGNNSTILRVKIFESGTDNLLVDETITTMANGYDGSVNLEGLTLPAKYDFLIKGYSHLQLRKDNVTLAAEPELVDFSEGKTVFVKAGDVNDTEGDNYVNGLDLSVLANNIYTADYRSDLNQDELVNGLEFSIAVTNLYQWGDF